VSEDDKSSNPHTGSNSSLVDYGDKHEQTIGFRTKVYAEIFREEEWTAKNSKNSKISDQVTHPFDAKFDICITVVTIVSMSPSNTNYKKTRVLEKYAATNWTYHFYDLELGKKDQPTPRRAHIHLDLKSKP
jgi:hypothetical protein